MSEETGAARSAHLESRLPAELRERLGAFRGRLWRIKTAEGVFAALIGLAVTYLVVFGLDRAFDTPAWLRGLLLALGVAGFALYLPVHLRRWVLGCRSLVQVARILVKVSPDAGDRLLGIVELAEDEREQRASPRLVEAAISQVAVDTRGLDLRQCVPDPRHRSRGVAAGLAMALGLAALCVPGAGSNAFLRWAMPWKDTPRYTFAQLDEVPSRVVAALGESETLTLRLSEDTAWSPASATARLGDQEPVVAQRDGDAYQFTFPAQTRPGEVRVRVGDARVRFDLVPLARPELTALAARLQLPDYLQLDPRDVDVRGGLVHAVEGSRVRLTATASRELAEASVDGVRVPTSGDRFDIAGFGVRDGLVRELRWTDVEGLQAREAFPVRVQTVADRPPTIGLRGLEFEQVVLDTEVLKLQVSASDDFGLREIGLEWNGVEDPEGRPQPRRGEIALAPGGPAESSMNVDGVFCAARLGIEPQPLELRAYTRDYRPDAERVYSATYRLLVLDAEQHMIWLTQRLGDWQDNVLEVRDQEQRLHDRNRELRGMSSSELDSEPARQELARQAEAERANGRRLDTLTDRGRSLIQEAVRNPEFNTATLEKWAAMLEALEGLANQRMPSVAEMLAQAASAPKKSSPSARSDVGIEAGHEVPGKEPTAGEDEPESEDPDAEGMPSVGNAVMNQGSGGDSDTPPPTVPGMVDMVKGADADPEMPDTSGDAPPPPPPSEGGGKFGLAATTMVGAPGSGGGSDTPSPPPAETPAQEDLDRALAEQAALLAEFNEVMDQIGEVLRNLQGSTFVKRLKAASRSEQQLASTLHGRLPWVFGEARDTLAPTDQEVLQRMSRKQVGTSEDLRLIQEDLIAYFDRVREAKFATVSEEMRDSEIVKILESSSDAILANYTGEAVAEAEYWKDELDRWAEILVGPG